MVWPVLKDIASIVPDLAPWVGGILKHYSRDGLVQCLMVQEKLLARTLKLICYKAHIIQNKPNFKAEHI